jgi:hypothetical protein
VVIGHEEEAKLIARTAVARGAVGDDAPSAAILILEGDDQRLFRLNVGFLLSYLIQSKDGDDNQHEKSPRWWRGGSKIKSSWIYGDFIISCAVDIKFFLHILPPPCHAGGAVSRGRMAVKLEHLITVTQITHQLARWGFSLNTVLQLLI